MVKYIVNRVLVTIPIIIAIILIVFLLLQVLPGNPIQVMMKEKVNQQVIDRVTEQMGLNDPLMIRFGRYLWNMLHGDLGQSYKLKRPVTQLIMTAFPNTVKLAITSALVAWIIGIPTGIISAIKKDSLLDRILMGFSLVGISLPVFWAAMLLQYFLGYKLKLLPISGYSTIRHMIMPAIVLGWASSGSIARLTRSSLLGVMKNDYIRTARAKGLVESAVVIRHGLKNSMIPVVTMMAMQFASLLSGAVITESVFGIGGIGQLMVSAISQRDMPLLQSSVIFSTMIIIVGNLVADILYSFLDPKIRTQ
ncbi:MAG: ABC transporter permease [Firmicutes bacterium]|nr:ABC transporter permease [Bacillota bacterium]MBQ1580354.1 ABC transporter permease [Bacillota bacterium]MBQ2147940.1 ABC transporter permease [Bacillota bacterium]MBQ2218110.1 ABC transporter permease [Bacillota bacterium]MBQ2227661.1 ABC transporter permease [Bacillota bacterium]